MRDTINRSGRGRGDIKVITHVSQHDPNPT